ncbi:hypothetical protein PAESOLCIP111_06478 [Paenibacillus solanacearum]|uniref:Uncharacterized protein n=1 Tax=Paenibacillus solanacearum TaxID=2048548 RepID=A0A916K809_9BACL|nr:hypothetical protein PAESOLCIP111_06478 [Paenibacillus solanacearum]
MILLFFLFNMDNLSITSMTTYAVNWRTLCFSSNSNTRPPINSRGSLMIFVLRYCSYYYLLAENVLILSQLV